MWRENHMSLQQPAPAGESPQADVSFFVTVHDANENETERHPAGRPVELTVPDDRFEARNWSA